MSVSSDRPHRPRRDQERNRRLLVRAASEVFAERGLDAPLDAIVKRAGLGSATLYRHFPRREDLSVEVLKITLGRSERALTDALEGESGWDGFATYLAWLFTEQIENLAYLSALRAVPAGQNAEVDRLRDHALAQLQELIGRAKTEGRFRDDRWTDHQESHVFLWRLSRPEPALRPHTADRDRTDSGLAGRQFCWSDHDL